VVVLTRVSPQLLGRAARRRARRIEFLFDPVAVAKTIGRLPNLAALLGDPHYEGEQSIHLPWARKSARELYRVLGNTQYRHLVQLLETLDACAGAGFTQPELLRTRGRRPFVEGIAELHVAEHLRSQRYKITGFDDTKDNDPVPDILAERDGLVAVIEVYCPRAWPGLSAYTDAIRDRVKNLDRCVNFEFRIEHEQLEQFGPGMRLLHLHPGDLSHGLDEQTRLEAIDVLLAELGTALDTGVPPQARYEFSDLNLVTSIELAAVGPASIPTPARAGVIGGPAISSYRPEAMFAGIVDRVIHKLEKGQAVDVVPGAVPILVVEMSQSDLTSELHHEDFYLPEFEKMLNAKLTNLHGYGVVAFCEVVEWGMRLVPQLLRLDPAVTDYDTARLLLP
jgi:hypothetical protein